MLYSYEVNLGGGLNMANRLDIHINKAYAVYKRYGVDATFALLYHAKPLSVEELSHHVRTTDQLISLDDTHYFIIFTFTDEEQAYKACQNILHFLDNLFNETSTCIAIDEFDSSHSCDIVMRRLHQILDQIQKNPYSRIENEQILDSYSF